MASKQPSVTEAEWRVMEALWERSPLSAPEVVESVRRRERWGAATVKTLLHRLAKKKIVRFVKLGNRYLYSAHWPKDRCVKQVSQSLVDRLFGGKSTPLLLHLVQSASLSPDEVQQLKQLLDHKEGSR